MTAQVVSPTTQTTLQTTESPYPLHIPGISKAVENALADLTIVITAWPRLPDAMRKGIVAMVQSASNEKK